MPSHLVTPAEVFVKNIWGSNQHSRHLRGCSEESWSSRFLGLTGHLLGSQFGDSEYRRCGAPKTGLPASMSTKGQAIAWLLSGVITPLVPTAQFYHTFFSRQRKIPTNNSCRTPVKWHLVPRRGGQNYFWMNVHKGHTNIQNWSKIPSAALPQLNLNPGLWYKSMRWAGRSWWFLWQSIRSPIPRTQRAKCCKLLQHQISTQPVLLAKLAPTGLPHVFLALSERQGLVRKGKQNVHIPSSTCVDMDQATKWQTLPCQLWIFKSLYIYISIYVYVYI